MTTRRAFLGVLAGGLLTPLSADAQRAGKALRIGYLHGGARTPDGAPPAALRQALQDLGHIEGKDALALPPHTAQRRDHSLELLAGLTTQIRELDDAITTAALAHPDAPRLITHPGVETRGQFKSSMLNPRSRSTSLSTRTPTTTGSAWTGDSVCRSFRAARRCSRGQRTSFSTRCSTSARASRMCTCGTSSASSGVSGPEIDSAYVAEWAQRLGLNAIWDAVLKRAQAHD